MGGFMIPGAVLAVRSVAPLSKTAADAAGYPAERARLPSRLTPASFSEPDRRPLGGHPTCHRVHHLACYQSDCKATNDLIADMQLPREEQDKHPMPARFWKGNELKELIHFDMTRTGVPGMQMAVKFRSWDDERRKISLAAKTHVTDVQGMV